MAGLTLTGITIVGLAGIGVAALVAPGMASRQYGIALADRRALAFLRAMGVRDLVIGILLGLLLWTGSRTALAWGMGAAALIAVVDFAVVWADVRPIGALADGAPPRQMSLGLHAIGILGLGMAVVLLLVGL